MNSLFSYESKFTQTVMQIADMLILNILFVLCSIPIFTIGAAQAALHSGIRQIMNKEDDTSCVKAFFKGFANGFSKITVAHILVFLVIGLMLWATGIAAIRSGNSLPTWICVIAVSITVMIHTMLPHFHAHFDCTPWQLIKNSFLLVITHPLRAFAAAVLTWIPFIVLLLNLYLFMQGFPLWVTLYYGVAFLFCYSIMKKPMADLREDFLKRQQPEEPAVTEV